VAKGELIRTVDQYVRSLAFSPQGNILATYADSPPSISFVDPTTAKEVRTIKDLGKFWVLTLRFSPDGKRLAAAGNSRAIRTVVAGSPDPATGLDRRSPFQEKRRPSVRNVARSGDLATTDVEGTHSLVAAERNGFSFSEQAWRAKRGLQDPWWGVLAALLISWTPAEFTRGHSRREVLIKSSCWNSP
jgi:hypothetical protein